MKKQATKRKRQRGPLIPAITVDFEEAVTRLLRVKPEPRPQRLAATKRKPR